MSESLNTLFLWTGNFARSTLAEALLNRLSLQSRLRDIGQTDDAVVK